MVLDDVKMVLDFFQFLAQNQPNNSNEKFDKF